MLCSLLCSRFPDRFACVFLHRFFVIVGRERRQRRKRIYISTHTHMWSLCTCYYSTAVGFDCQKGDERIPSLFFCMFVFPSQNLSDVSPHAMTRPPNQTKDPPITQMCHSHQFLSTLEIPGWLISHPRSFFFFAKVSLSLSRRLMDLCEHLLLYSMQTVHTSIRLYRNRS
jgi:hypothetical protein